MKSRLLLINIGLLAVTFIMVACSGTNAVNESAMSDITQSEEVLDDDTASDSNNGNINTDDSNTVTVSFDITVPAYMSDALQVRVAWGDQNLNARWVGDELWSAVGVFPQNTEQQLVITFYDDNGAITLASAEQSYKTAVEDFETLVIAADQFNTAKWDTDNDGISNLAELIAGSNLPDSQRVLLFSETRGYRHDSIESALQALEELAASNNIRTNRAGDSDGVFNDANLATYDAVVWVLTSGDVLDNNEQAAFERFIQAGGGYAGIHAASDTEYDWPWYGSLVGAYFSSHPEIQQHI